VIRCAWVPPFAGRRERSRVETIGDVLILGLWMPDRAGGAVERCGALGRRS
jgi:hypothetical protein